MYIYNSSLINPIFSPVTYTISINILINNFSKEWRNIFTLSDNYRSPSVWIEHDTNKIEFYNVTAYGQDGFYFLTDYKIPLNQTVNLIFVMNSENSIVKLYVNGNYNYWQTIPNNKLLGWYNPNQLNKPDKLKINVNFET